MASEDHDLAEVDQVALPTKADIQTLRMNLRSHGEEVGNLTLGDSVGDVLDEVSGLLSYAPICDLLRECYTPSATLANAFGRLIGTIFKGHGLVVLDANTKAFHALGALTLQAAIERAAEFEAALLERSAALEASGYHAQVLVKAGASLLFLVNLETHERQPLRRSAGGIWKAGTSTYSTRELLAILAESPERLSPNALLRPVFQDTILPTAAYVGGPAEVAYFAQSAVLYERILGRVTPILPRFSATLIEPAIASIMKRDEVTLASLFEAKTIDALTQRLGARAMPIESKRRLSATGNALDQELTAMLEYLTAMDDSLGRSAAVSASKMRYQMNRLRRMAAAFEVQRDATLRKHATTMMLNLFPEGHPQERLLGGIWFLARCGEGLIDQLVHEATEMCTGHTVLYL